MLTAARLRELLHYDPVTGLFKWRVSSARIAAGQVAGNISGGYVRIKIEGRKHRAHRLAVLYMTGSWPKRLVDHKDGDGCNNRWTNLRRADDNRNTQNAKRRVDNTTGFKGVTKSGSKFVARVRANGVNIYLGRFSTALAAHAAYCSKASELHGDFFKSG